jgi:hypothetical protein
MKFFSGAPSPKVTVGSLSGLALTGITWLLTEYIPAWHSGVPAQIQPLIPAILGVIGYFGGGYATKHPATLAEVEIAIKDAENVLNLVNSANLAKPLVPAGFSTSDASPPAATSVSGGGGVGQPG